VAGGDEKMPGTLRFLTLNLWGENGPWQDRMELLLDGLVADQRTDALPTLETDVAMPDAAGRERLARETLLFSLALG